MPNHIIARRARSLAVAALVAPCVAQAQLGGFIKRAVGEKVAEKVVQKADERPDSAAGRAGRARVRTEAAPMASIQLTPDTLDRALRGLDVLARAFARRDSLGQAAHEVSRRVSELSEANGNLGDSYREKLTAVQGCRREAFRSIGNKRGLELQKRMAADPALQKRMSTVWLNYNAAAMEAAQKGDSVTLARLQGEYYRAALGPDFDFRRDTVAVTGQCGAEPVKPAKLALEDSLRLESQRLADRRREVETDARTEAIAQSGLPAERFDAARERIEMWYRGRKAGVLPFPAGEEEALEAQRPRIDRIMRALGVQR